MVHCTPHPFASFPLNLAQRACSAYRVFWIEVILTYGFLFDQIWTFWLSLGMLRCLELNFSQISFLNLMTCCFWVNLSDINSHPLVPGSHHRIYNLNENWTSSHGQVEGRSHLLFSAAEPVTSLRSGNSISFQLLPVSLSLHVCGLSANSLSLPSSCFNIHCYSSNIVLHNLT